jgi:hypothetical protein
VCPTPGVFGCNMTNSLKEWQLQAACEINGAWWKALIERGEPPHIESVAAIIAAWMPSRMNEYTHMKDGRPRLALVWSKPKPVSK